MKIELAKGSPGEIGAMMECLQRSGLLRSGFAVLRLSCDDRGAATLSVEPMEPDLQAGPRWTYEVEAAVALGFVRGFNAARHWVKA